MSCLRDVLAYKPRELSFGTSGLRDLVTDMTDLECYINTVGFLRFLKQTKQLDAGDVVYVAGDLRDSTPRIMRSVARAAGDEGCRVNYCGLIPTPALGLAALSHKSAGIMVTGSHIPADRNGIKFYKPDGEVLKEDEAAIKVAVASVRQELYAVDAVEAIFDERGEFREVVDLPAAEEAAERMYVDRFKAIFKGRPLAGKKVVVYQHSAVGRDLVVEILTALGAEAVPMGRSDVFVPFDSENITSHHEEYVVRLVQEHPGSFAIVSTDGDSDRPMVFDAAGEFHRGDVLGAVVAVWLKAEFAAYPVTASDAADSYLGSAGIEWRHTRIGSPYVISAMAQGAGAGSLAVGWEVNGGFMTQTPLEVNGATLAPLPTRDAILPIVVALVAAAESGRSVSELFGALPRRYSQAGLVDNFPAEASRAIVAEFAHDTGAVYAKLGEFFTIEHGFGTVKKVNHLDGVRIYFDNGDVVHFRPSGNAPQLRVYSVAGSQQRADEIVELVIKDGGIFRQMEHELSQARGRVIR